MFCQGLIVLLIAEGIFAYTSSICAEVPNGYFVRSSQSCNSYNKCTNGQPSHGMCPKGYSFNPVGQTCSYNIDVDCEKCSPYGIQNIPHPDNCSMFYRCTNGIRTTMTCPNELLFDRNYGDCNLAHRVTCVPKNTICEQFRHLYWLGAISIGNPLDCQSYYYCINGRAVESVCPNGLFYNPYNASCEVMRAVNFCQPIGPLITTPIPELTTREILATESTTQTTVKYIYFTTASTQSTSETTTQQSTTLSITTTSTSTLSPSTISTSTTSTSTTTTPTPTITAPPATEPTTNTTPEEETTEEGTSEEETTEEETSEEEEPEPTEPAAIEYPNCPAEVTGYFPMPYPENCTRYYYCSKGLLRFSPFTCAPGLFFTPGSDRCSSDVPPHCEYLLESMRK